MTRNRGRPSLRHLSSAPPTREERKEIADTAFNYEGSPIVTAILGAITIEIELDTLLRQRFPKIDDSLWSSMVGDHGPFSTFDQKITAAFAFRIFDEATKDNLKIIKKIRNVFAHAKKLINFDDPLISGEIRKLRVPSFRKKFHTKISNGGHYTPKEAYVLLCIVISTFLIQKQANALSAKARRLQKKRLGDRIPISPLANALVDSARQQNLSSLSPAPLASLPSLADYSKKPSELRYLSGLLPFLDVLKKDHND